MNTQKYASGGAGPVITKFVKEIIDDLQLDPVMAMSAPLLGHFTIDGSILQGAVEMLVRESFRAEIVILAAFKEKTKHKYAVVEETQNGKCVYYKSKKNNVFNITICELKK